MHTLFKNMYQKAFDAVQLMYRSARGIDHKILTHYMLKINQLQDVDSIIYHASRCLRSMLDYQFFAFAMYDREYNGGIDIWMDPRTDSMPIMSCIKKDFASHNLYCNVRYFTSTADETPVTPVDPASMLTLTVMDTQTRAILYIVPRRNILAYHHELLHVIVTTLATALSNFISLKKLESAALIDPLTHCYNRRALDGQLEHDVGSAERYGADLSLVMFDMDYFKKINDTCGHSAGDAVLRAVSKGVLAAIRKSDYLARFGGEEFVLVLPETKFSKAIELAERLRQIIEAMKVTLDDNVITVTASFGVTAYKKGTNRDILLQRADEMLYEAKRQGRNRIKPDLKVYHRSSSSALTSEDSSR